MLGAYFSPLAPVAILLLSAFILPVVMPRLPEDRALIRDFAAPGLVGVAILSLFGIRLSSDAGVTVEGLELLSGWNFSTAESAAALTIRADALSLSFLIIVLLVLLAGTLLGSGEEEKQWLPISGWLVMGAGACLLFVSGNSLTLVYGVMLFDIFSAGYWLGRDHRNLGVARLFLGIFTAAGLMVATLIPSFGGISAILLFGLALWLRLGLYPFIETTAHAHWRSDERLVYLGLSLAVGMYLAIRGISESLPLPIYWLVVITMLLTGLLAWLAEVHQVEAGDINEGVSERTDGRRASILVWLILTQSLLILIARVSLIASPMSTGAAIAFAVGLILSLVALWVTPAIGRPRFSRDSWPYLPAAAATLTLMGLPLTLGWPGFISIYEQVLRIDNLFIILITVLAGGLALSGLVRYWLILGYGHENSDRRTVVGVVAALPFLTPVLAPLILSTMTGIDLSLTSVEISSGILIVMGGTIIGAIGMGYFRPQIIERLNIPVTTVTQLCQLHWLFRWIGRGLDQVGKALLRVRVTLEGQHYLGWAIFAALVGVIILLLDE